MAETAAATDESLDGVTEPVEGPGWPEPRSYPVGECLLVILNEEWSTGSTRSGTWTFWKRSREGARPHGAVTAIALFMVSLDNLVVTTALPVIRLDLGASLQELGGEGGGERGRGEAGVGRKGVLQRVDRQRLHPHVRRPASCRVPRSASLRTTPVLIVAAATSSP